MEYKYLVKRMAELEKLKKARQYANNMKNTFTSTIKDTLKPRNVTIDNWNISNLDERINLSR